VTDLWSELKIGKIVLKNRLGMAPMGTLKMHEDGTPSDQMLCYYSAQAKSGVAVVVVEVTLVTEKYGNRLPRISNFHSDYQIEMFKQLAAAIKAHGAVAILQLALGIGVQGARDENLAPRYGEAVSASAYPIRIPENSMPRAFSSMEWMSLPSPRALPVEEIEALQKSFCDAAQRAKRAGFDGIEIHACHGLLVADFMSTFSNQRTDAYGGSLGRSLKLVLSLIHDLNRRVRDDNFVLGIRLSADEHTVGGLSLEDNKQIVPLLEEAGIDYLSLGSGRAESAFNWSFPEKEGKLIEEVSEIKKICNVPVMCPNIHQPEVAERLIAEGKADLVLLGRALLADPEWPRKAKEEKASEIVPCVFCFTCLACHARDENLRCIQNPNLGRERFMSEFWPLPFRQERVGAGGKLL